MIFSVLDASTGALLGAVLGSFLNVVIHRLPIMLERDWKNQCLAMGIALPGKAPHAGTYNLCWPPSHCPSCQKTLPFYLNLPVITFLFLRGRCAFCQNPIPIRYLLVEIITCLLWAICIGRWGWEPNGLAAGFFVSILIALTAIDLETQLLPDELTQPLLWAGLWINSQWMLFCDPNAAILGAIFGYLSLWSVYWGFKWMTGKEGMGYGDFKLLAALGAWFGWMALPSLILLGSGVGAVIGILQIGLKKHAWQTPMAFGPYLAGAGFFWLMMFKVGGAG